MKRLSNQLAVNYIPLVHCLAYKISSRLPSNIDINDLISAGFIGLIDAIGKYDSSRGNKFETYAGFRIRGAILDELRAQDWIPRSVRDKAKRIESTYIELEQRFGRTVSDQEMSQELGVSLPEYYEMVEKSKLITQLSFVEPIAQLERFQDADSENPFEVLERKHLSEMLINCINDLPKKQKFVWEMYHYEGLTLKEIGRLLGVSEGWVSDIRTNTAEILLLKLKEALAG